MGKLTGDLSDEPDSGYPYICPKCGRPFKTLIPLEVHLESFDHNNPPEGYDPCDMDWKPKKRKERLKELEEKERNESGSDVPTTSTPGRQGGPGRGHTTPGSRRGTPGSRRGRSYFGSHRKRKVRKIDIHSQHAPIRDDSSQT